MRWIGDLTNTRNRARGKPDLSCVAKREVEKLGDDVIEVGWETYRRLQQANSATQWVRA